MKKRKYVVKQSAALLCSIVLALTGIQANPVFAEEQMAVGSVSEGGLLGEGEAAGKQEVNPSSVLGGDVLDGGEASGEQGAGISSVPGGDVQVSGEVSNGQDAGVSSVSGGDAAGGAVESGMEGVGTSSVSGGDAAGSGGPGIYSMALAVIVRHIFSLAEQGMSSTQIAKELIREKTPTITQMRYPERKMARENHAWSSTAVRALLNNRFYLGEMAYGKSIRKSVGSKEGIAVPKNEWKVITDHHEPLVTPEVFALASSFRPEQSTRRKRPKHPLTGKIYCGGCGYSINYKPQGNSKIPNHFWCRKHSLLQIPDCCTYFNAAILEEIVLTELYRELMRRGDLIKQRERLEQFQKGELHRLGRDMENSRMQYRSLQKEADALYESYALKQTEAVDYRSRADGIALRMQKLTCKIEKAEQELARLTEEYHRPKQDMKDILRFAEMKELTQEMVDVFIKKVIVYKGKRVEIEWNYALGEE